MSALTVLALRLCSLVSLACLFALQVLGGCGAFWGATQVYELRTNGVIGVANGWADAAQWIGAACLARFVVVHFLDPKLWAGFKAGLAAQAREGARPSLLFLLGRALEAPVPAMWHGLGGEQPSGDEGYSAELEKA